MDANLNRLKEGLRVCEDVCRFLIDDSKLTNEYKVVRHQLTCEIKKLKINNLIFARDINHDVGRRSIAGELKRGNVDDIFYANSQRVKESIRVLEEFSKLIDKNEAQKFKKIRYKIYAVEKKVAQRL